LALAWGRWNMVLTNDTCILVTPDIVGDDDDVGSVVGRGRGGEEEGDGPNTMDVVVVVRPLC
jgi:hypothetical protein